MALSLRDCTFFGSALSESFALNDLEGVLAKERLLEKPSGAGRQELEEGWESYRRKLRALGEQGGALRVQHHVLDPLAARLGYGAPQAAGAVMTREAEEDGGFVYATAGGPKLRAWAVDLGTDLDAPNQRGRAYRFSPARVAERVLLSAGERVGLLTDGDELRIVIVDPARPGSHVAIALGRSGGWRGAPVVPDSYRLVHALASPAGVLKIGAITEAARLAQSRVTKSLRDQARRAIEGFVQALLDHPANEPALAEWPDREALARTLWREGLVVVYRLLFILKLEASADPARAFSFASTSLWRNTYSPNVALAPVVKDVVERGAVTGSFLADTLRATFRLFLEGLASSELKVSPLGGMLFGAESAPFVSRLAWTEEGVAALLDNLLWTREREQSARARVHYGSLDVEDLGRVYEALLELEPGIAGVPMCRLRRAKLEVVVEAAKGEPYRTAARPDAAETKEGDEDEEDDATDDDAPKRGKAKTVWVEDIAKGRFFLRVGLGRKATGSYYTPHSFVRFLVQETLGPQVSERSPADDPKPGEILKLTVLDPAMGSGHFLVEACRFLGEKLYEATRLCDGLSEDAERAAAASRDAAERERILGRSRELRHRVEDLPDPNNELVAYLPSRAAEGVESGLSQSRALAICRRLVAVHCLYGVDKNPLAVELAKVSLWLESYAEGLPLTFLDHRLICGDSLLGPGINDVFRRPGSDAPLDDLFVQHLAARLRACLVAALAHVRDLNASVGKDIADVQRKSNAKAQLDKAIAPFRALAQAWAGGVADPSICDDAAYEAMIRAIGDGDWPCVPQPVRAMVDAGAGALSYELTFPEVFFPDGNLDRKAGFSAILGNPPWDKRRFERKELLGSFFPQILEVHRAREWEAAVKPLIDATPEAASALEVARLALEGQTRVLDRLYPEASGRGRDVEAAGEKDLYLFFCERALTIAPDGAMGLLLGGGFGKNSAAAGMRQLLVRTRRTSALMQFVNLEGLFADLPPVVEFCLIVVSKARNDSVRVASGLTRFDELERLEAVETVPISAIVPPTWLFRATGPTSAVQPLGDLLESIGGLTAELHKTADDGGFVAVSSVIDSIADARPWSATNALVSRGVLPLRGSRTFGVLNPRPDGLGGSRSPAITLGVSATYVRARRFLERARYYRVGVRRHVGSTHTNERAIVACVFTPGVLCNDQVLIEGQPWSRPNSRALYVAGVLSSFAVEAPIRSLVGSMMSGTILKQANAPILDPDSIRFIVHSVLRLVADDDGYAPLLKEQLGVRWSEAGAEWPQVRNNVERWQVRARIDALVAAGLGLSVGQYRDVLSLFSHSSFPEAPKLCVLAFEEMRACGLREFCRAHDPYFDVALVETPPLPVIDLPTPAEVPGPLPSARGEARESKGAADQLALGEFHLAAEPVARPSRKPKKTR